MVSPKFTPQSETFPIPDIIPIFPLPNVVFFPDTFLPLHIFEPRYRDMVADANMEGHCIGMVLLKDGWEDHYYENPPIFQLGCVGRIVQCETLPDGRSNIILEGLHRFEILEELSQASYRQGRVTLKPSDPQSQIDDSVRSLIIGKAQAYFQLRKVSGLTNLISSPKLTDCQLVNCLSSCLDISTLEKQFLLESDHLLQQARRLIDLLEFKLHEHSVSPR